MLQLSDVRLFVEIMRTGSFTAAGQAVGVPKSSVARQISRLEDELGCRLIDRTTRSVLLTDEGRTFLPHARRLVDDSIEAMSVIRQNREGASGLLVVTSPSAFGRFFLAPYIPEFRRRFPNIRLELKLTARKMGLEVGGADIAVRFGPIIDPTLGVRNFGQITFGLVATPAYLKGRAPVRDPLDLSKHELIELRPPAGDNLVELYRDGKLVATRCIPGVSVDDPEAAKFICMGDGGIAMLPTFLILDEISRGSLVPILPDWSLPPTPIHVVYANQTSLPLRVRAFIDFLFDRVEFEFTARTAPRAPGAAG